MLVLWERHRDEVVEAEIKEVDWFQGIVIEDEKVRCQVDKISDSTKFMLMISIFHQKTGYSDGFFNKVFIIQILITGRFDVLCGNVTDHSLKKTIVLFPEHIIRVFPLIFFRSLQFFENLKKQFNNFWHFYFLNQHCEFIRLDIFLKISIDGKTKNITNQLIFGQ